MSVAKKLIRTTNLLGGTIYSLFPFQGISRPIFVLGCRRSGTTIFGTVLSKQRKITYLNEPRRLWRACYPETDIWSKKAAARNGKLILTDADTEQKKSLKLRRLFRFETIRRGRPVLVEKTPINNFRLRFILEIFPDARFIHIYRNGLEVAKSIEKVSERHGKFVANPRKWEQLARLASTTKETSALPEFCDSYYEKGLLEWRLSTETTVSFLQNMPEESFFELSYGELIKNPVKTIKRVLNFIGLDADREVTDFMKNNISRKTDNLDNKPLSEREKLIGGDLLPISMQFEKGLIG